MFKHKVYFKKTESRKSVMMIFKQNGKGNLQHNRMEREKKKFQEVLIPKRRN